MLLTPLRTRLAGNMVPHVVRPWSVCSINMLQSDLGSKSSALTLFKIVIILYYLY